ncbi:MAG: dihydrofolate reductase [Azonexus sp.]|jgi:dihydrofolate reductase|uniref:dihydrofolate reductase n=1 Tax=Azonexus sp. TaxID=1872668 RepID=UPI002819E401|nr:dihydrofolate reductase [Azonexus sp.]MDR0776938.1 dihydrofolate reductase [Azonexus sp.]
MERAAPLIAAIGAVASNGMLGLGNWLPWDIPEELAYFEATVAGAALLIGRLTYESMDEVPVDSFIVSRRANLALRPGCRQVASVEEGLRAALATGKPVFVIGGAAIYAAAWPYCRRFYLTRIDRPFAGDTLFPESVPLASWPLLSETVKHLRERRGGGEVMCRFQIYEQPQPRLLPALEQDSAANRPE